MAVNGVQKFKVDEAGNSTQAGTLTVSGAGNSTFAGSVGISGILYDSSADAGISGQILSSTATGTNWINAPSNMVIGGTINSATAGSILFAGTAEVLTQDNANFFWDDVSDRLGIGTANPSRTLDTRGTGLNIFGNGSTTELMLRERGGTLRDTGAWHLSLRSDVGGNNDDLKFVRFVGGVYQDIPFQIQNSTGNVGIGTTGPGAKLDVLGGSIRTTNQLISTVATGTVPLAVSSTTLNTNLNADLLDGLHSASFYSASNPSGYITSAGRAYPRRSDGADLNFYWSGQAGQPTWLWGGTDGANMYVYNPSNFSVNYATSAGYASNAGYASSAGAVNGYSFNQWLQTSNSPIFAGMTISNVGYVSFSATDGSIELASGNDGASFIDFKGSANLGSDYQGRIGFNDGSGFGIIGNVGIGVAPSYQLQLGANSAAKPSTNTWTIASDSRVKTDIQDFNDGLDVIMGVNPITYKYNGKAGFLDTTSTNVGVIAQDIMNVAPYTVGTFMTKLNPDDTEETELYNFDSGDLTFVTINAIQEQQAEIINSKLEISNLVLKTDADIANLAQLQSSIDTQLGVVQISLAALATADTQQVGRLTTLEATSTQQETRLTALEKLITTLQGQIDTLTAQRVLDIADAQLAMTNLEILLDIKTDKTDFNFGHFTAENLETGLLTIKVVDEESATIGTATISNGETSVVVPTTAVSADSKIFVTVRKADEAVPVKVGTIVAGESFAIEISKALTSPVELDWWIVEAK
jgi:hypothetical protein